MRIAAQVAWQLVDGEAIVVDLSSGKTIGLNPTGTYLWSHLDGRDESELARGLAEEFEVDLETARGDVQEFLTMLRERQLVSES